MIPRPYLIIFLGISLLGLFVDTAFGRDEPPTEADSLRVGAIDWGWALTVARDYATPLGTYYEDARPGTGYEFRVARSLSRHVALRLSYARYGLDFETFTEFETISSLDGQDVGHRLTEAQLQVHALTVGVQYLRWIDRFRRNRTKVYFSLDVGVARHTTEGNVTIWTSGVDEDVITYHQSVDDDHGLLRTGGGFVVPLGRRLQIDTGAEINLIWVRENNVEDVRKVIYGIKGYIFRITAGLTWTI